ncbi:MAG: Eco57I restriction-modification methylase domain-containing protein [Chloroflexi bacterium]|nr:Eco57I restriction-modification methylase domain-containing protein [Chloroflexota bacterium]
MPILNRQDAADVDAYMQRIFAAPPTQRAQAIRRFFVEKLDFAGATGLISLAKAPQTVSLPSNAERIASLQGLNVVYVALPGGASRVRKAEAAAAARLVSDQLGDVLLVFTNGTGSQLHFVSPTFVGAAPSLRRMIIERDLPRRTAVMQLSNVYWQWKDAGSVAITDAIERAFDVEAVTKEFYQEYERVFKTVMEKVKGFGASQAEQEAKKLFVQTLFNRLMFVYFISRKGWLNFDGNVDYLNALRKDYPAQSEDRNFYDNRLKVLFFAGLNNPGSRDVTRGTSPLIGYVPFLNGGLFEETPVDRRPGVVVPDDAIDEITQKLFDRFNFTVMESSPLDVEVAVDPEMLGKVFEELVTGRHESGSYYTPRPVVAFMCREALKGYLETQNTGASPEAIAAFVDRKDTGQLTISTAPKIGEALARVTVVDPACGSGAYLLGMMQELVELMTTLYSAQLRHEAKEVYDLKLQIIEQTLHGADIDQFAVNIAMLRLWLSLAIEYDGPTPPPLPNLDFKIEQGDSLAAPWPQATEKLTFQDELVKRFRDAKGAYLTVHGGPKDTLRKKIDGLRTDIGQWAHGKDKVAGFDWIVEFAEVFADGGFDIALANPPYRRQEGLGAEKLQLERLYPQVYASTADYHVYFYNRSVQLLRDGGVLSFITSNKYMRAGYGEKIRGFLPSALTLGQVVDFGDLPVFTAAAYPAIVVGQKQPPLEGHSLRVADLAAPIRRYLMAQGKPVNRETVTAVMERLPVFLAESAVPAYPQMLLRKSGWILEDPALVRLFDRLMSQGTPLGKYVNGRMYRGVLTGLNDAFVIDEAERQELIKADPRSAEVIKPWLRGRDIKRWRVEPAGLYVIFTRRGINIKQYPAIQEHLARFRHPHVDEQRKQVKGLEPRGGKDYRKPGPYQWYEIQDNIAYYREFAEPKVVWGNLAVESKFAFDKSGAFVGAPANLLSNPPSWLLAVMNSNLLNYLYTKLTVFRGGSYQEFKISYISPAPIVVPNGRTANRLSQIQAKLTSSVIADPVKLQDAQLEADDLVYDLYGVKAEERRLIISWQDTFRLMSPSGDDADESQDDA